MPLRIEGITIHEAGPIGNVAFRLHAGVDVLYGRNGAGKSFILDCIRRALTGTSDYHELLLHCRLEADTDPGIDWSIPTDGVVSAIGKGRMMSRFAQRPPQDLSEALLLISES